MAVNTNDLRDRAESLWAYAHILDEDFHDIMDALDELDDVRTERNILKRKLLANNVADFLATVAGAFAGAAVGVFLAILT